MKYYLAITDSNSRQYNFEITGDFLTIVVNEGFIDLKKDGSNLDEFIGIIEDSSSFKVGNAVFNSKWIVAIQYHQIPEENS